MKLRSRELIALTITFVYLATPTWGQTTESEALETTTTTTTTSNTSCILSIGTIGECVNIRKCPTILKELKLKRDNDEFVRYVKDSNLVCNKVGQNVCCPKQDVLVDPVPRRLPTPEERCGFQPKISVRKIVGGSNAKLGAWPWIALLAYDYGSSYLFKCGGTLITARHVLTAAHCILDDLVFVRLGEHDLSTETETHHVDINVVKKVPYPNFTKRTGRGDLAILFLERNVEFTKLIVPICLPNTPRLLEKSYVESNPFVIGWGKTEEGGDSSNILNELQVTVWDNEVCRSSYEKINRSFTEDQFDSAVLCAGDLQGGKDSCQGDSGGPLMAPEFVERVGFRYFLIGVVAYGYGCARPNAPGVYTSTQHFMDWILEQVKDTP